MNIIEDDMEIEEVSRKNWNSVEEALNLNRADMNELLSALKVQNNQIVALTERLIAIEQRVGMLIGQVRGGGPTA